MRNCSAQAVLCTEVKHAAFLKTDRPVAVWTDSLYGGLFDYYQTFTGLEWKRKGGDTAVKTVEVLNKKGIRTEITFLGTDPARHLTHVPDFVKRTGFLSLAKPDERSRMEQLYRNAHFLIQPSRAECFGHIFPEANSFALPAITSNTGGIPTAVHEGINGYCVDPESVSGYAECIGRLFSNPDQYRVLAMNAFDDYTDRLSWRQTVRRVRDMLIEL